MKGFEKMEGREEGRKEGEKEENVMVRVDWMINVFIKNKTIIKTKRTSKPAELHPQNRNTLSSANNTYIFYTNRQDWQTGSSSLAHHEPRSYEVQLKKGAQEE